MTRAQSAQSDATTTATSGWVSFVGSGPGDPGLLTVRAVELLRDAEVIVTESPSTSTWCAAARAPTDRGRDGPMLVDGGFGEDGQPLTHAARAHVVIKHGKKAASCA